MTRTGDQKNKLKVNRGRNKFAAHHPSQPQNISWAPTGGGGPTGAVAPPETFLLTFFRAMRNIISLNILFSRHKFYILLFSLKIVNALVSNWLQLTIFSANNEIVPKK